MTSDDEATIVSVRNEVIEIELAEAFAIAGGSQPSARMVLSSLTLADGTVGLGEAAPLPAYDGETVETALAAVDRAARELPGDDARRWRHVAGRIGTLTLGSRSARCALETALLDALCQQRKLSLHSFFGGSSSEELVTDVTIPIGSVGAAARSARDWTGRGFESLKVKVGGPNDLERIVTVREHAPHARLMLDANAGLSQAQALSLLSALRDRDIEPSLFEQPVAAENWEGLLALKKAGVRVALDESVATARDVLAAVKHLGADIVINIKLMKSGIVEAMAIAATAKACGASLMIGGMVESSLAMTVSACFAAGLGGFEFVDLDTHLFLRDSPFRGGLAARGAALSLAAIHSGHGVRLA
jgi:L-Ala-D/L-Glu epimerase